MELIDTHCHLTFKPLVDQLDLVLLRARNRSVIRILVPAYDLASWKSVQEISKRDGVYAAYGLHPWSAEEPMDIDHLDRILDSKKAVAVGEIGLDSKVTSVHLERQREILDMQIAVAVSHKLPVILHCRGAYEMLLTVLSKYSGRVQGVIHAFARGPELMQRFLDHGFYIAFGGSITRPRAKRARTSAKIIPLQNILLETDSPSIGLEGIQPENTEPHHIFDIAQSLAEIREIDIESVAKSTSENAKKLFNLP